MSRQTVAPSATPNQPTLALWWRFTAVAVAGLLILGGAFGLGSAGLLGTFLPAAHAVETSEDGSLQVTSSSRVYIAAGETFEYNLSAVNTSTEPITYTAYASSYYVNSETYTSASFNTENTYTQMARWITLQDAEGNYSEQVTRTVASGETDVLTYRITVPDDIPDGGQYAVIFFEVGGDSAESGESTSAGITTVTRAGSILYASTEGGNTLATATIDYMDVSSFIVSGNFTSTASVTNTGNTDVAVVYTIDMTTVFGRTVYEVIATSGGNSQYVLPETTWKISNEWEETPLMGVFLEDFTIEIDGEETVLSSLLVKLPVFVIVLMILFLTVIVAWIIILVKNRRDHKARRRV